MMVPRLPGPCQSWTNRTPRSTRRRAISSLTCRAVLPVQRRDGCRLLADIERIAGVHLHPVGELEGLNARLQRASRPPARLVLRLSWWSKSSCGAAAALVALVFGYFRSACRAACAASRCRCPDRPPAGNRSASSPHLLDRIAARAHGDKSRQVLILGAKPIDHPGADARTHLRLAAVHEHQARLMIRYIGVHRSDDGRYRRCAPPSCGRVR